MRKLFYLFSAFIIPYGIGLVLLTHFGEEAFYFQSSYLMFGVLVVVSVGVGAIVAKVMSMGIVKDLNKLRVLVEKIEHKDIEGMEVQQVAIGSCNSLEQYERSLHSNEPYPEGIGQDPVQVALSAFYDAGLDDDNNLILISTPHATLLDLPSVLRLQPNQYQSIAPKNGSDYVVLEQADRLIQEDPNRIVLFPLTTGSETVSLVLMHPDQAVTGAIQTVFFVSVSPCKFIVSASFGISFPRRL